jgi:hypothetical protein
MNIEQIHHIPVHLWVQAQYVWAMGERAWNVWCSDFGIADLGD